jgi:dolichol-phosphate mannosyltransferase
MSRKIIIIPTYNEAKNIGILLNKLQVFNLNILIIDDNSPDNTAAIVKNLMEANSNLHLIQRKNKLGLGSAYREGFRYCIDKGFESFIQMDADFSHRIEDLSSLIANTPNYDVIIGSRYVNGGATKGWSVNRMLLSKFANTYARCITGCKIKDLTSGFRIYSLKALKEIEFEKTTCNGYGFQIEMTSRAFNRDLKIKEVPIIFHERELGVSKINFKIILEAVFVVFKIRINKY